MILGIDHIGLASDDPAGVGVFLAALGMAKADAGIADAYGVACEFWQYPGQPAVEIVSPVTDDSSVAGRLERSGPGLYHLAFVVDDIDAELSRLRGHGFVPIDARPCAGAKEGMEVAFMYSRRPAALLIELVRYREN
ncbi:methylmalonyl-CoA epimerase [Actinoallomurus acanthiterrae]